MEHNTTQLKKFTPETMKEIVYVTSPAPIITTSYIRNPSFNLLS